MNVAQLPRRGEVRSDARGGLRERLPHITPAAAAKARAVYAQPAWPLRRGGLGLVWQHSGPPSAVEGLQCSAPAGPFWLGLDDWSVLSPQLALAMTQLPPEIRLGLVEHAAEPLLACLPRLTGGPIVCSGLLPAPGGDANGQTQCLGFRLIDAHGQAVAQGWWVGDTAGLAWPAAAAFDTAALARLAVVPVALPLSLGACTLPWAELRTLVCGDLLRLDVPPQAHGALRLHARLGGAGAAALVCSARESTLTVEACVSITFDTLEPERPDTPALTDLGQIPCTVVVELGRLRMSMAELARMRPGHTLELGADPAAAAVRLVVNGRTIGRGELVTVGDELAVAVQSLELPSDG